VVRRAIVGLVGIVAMLGLVVGPPPAEAAINSCSLNGTYILSGLGEAAGFLEVVGSLIFTPTTPACTGGTLGGSVTIRRQGAAPTPFTPSGTYSVNSSGSVTATVPGVIDLVGVISLVTSPDNVANTIHLVVTFTGPQVLALTATRNTPTAGLTGAVGSITLSGDLNLPATTSATAGVLTLAGAPFLHAFGTANTFLGANAGNFTMTGGANTATGADALSHNTTGGNNTATGRNALASNTTGGNNTATGRDALASNTTGGFNTATGEDSLASNTTGSGNTATGFGALTSNTTGSDNTALGVAALPGNTTGSANTAVGEGALASNTTGDGNTVTGGNALASNTTGSRNTATGRNALTSNTTGTGNTALGVDAGAALTSGDNNIYLGSPAGAASESGRIRLGEAGTQTATFVAGIRGTTTAANNAIAVFIDVNGQLGTASSSRRVKTDIEAMGAASESLLRLRPVSFRYTAHAAQGGPREYGLIAEEVAEVLPDLVVYDPAGQPETVRYHELPAMLLNELQKQHRTLQALQERLGQLEELLSQRAAR
jgi:hypothetical protein